MEHRTVFSGDPPPPQPSLNAQPQGNGKGKDKDHESTPKTKTSPPPPDNNDPQRSQHFNNTTHKAEYKPPDSNAEQNHATTRFESKNQGDGGKIAKNLQTMSELIDIGNTNTTKNIQEKAAETFWVFEETCYELISQINEDQHEEYIGKITDT